MKEISHKDYLANFGIEANNPPSGIPPLKLSNTFELVLATRQFEIQMYWTRTAYFWTLIGAAFAGFFALQASDTSLEVKQFLGFTISVIGAVLSFGWGLANKGSKYWHENWENHAQLLEDTMVGPIFKTLLERVKPNTPKGHLSQILVGPSKFSVSKINLLFSWFFFVLWLCLSLMSLPEFKLDNAIDYRYVMIGGASLIFAWLLLYFGRTWDKDQKHVARLRRTKIRRLLKRSLRPQ